MRKRKLIPADQEPKINIDLDELLEYITKNVYDATHIGNITTRPEWVIGVFNQYFPGGLLDWLRDKAKLTSKQMRDRYDAARVRAHGPNVKGGR